MTDISNTDNMLDGCDIVKRIEELEAELAEYTMHHDEETDVTTWTDSDGDECDLADEDEELRELKAFVEDIRADLDTIRQGLTFVHDDYFEQYAEQYASDIGAIDSDLGWPACHVDWEAAAASLQQDWTYADWDGSKYWFREA